MDKISVPHSRFRRELRKWMRFIENNPDEVVYITINKIEVELLISPEKFDLIKHEI